MIGVDRYLFFVLDLKQGRLFLDNLDVVSG
jgi:hypothetical protein